MRRVKLILLIIASFLAKMATCQEIDSTKTLFFKLNKNHRYSGQSTTGYRAGSFYLFRNAHYWIVLKNKEVVSGRFLGIVGSDSFAITNFISAEIAAKNGNPFDTIFFPVTRIKMFRFIDEESWNFAANAYSRDYGVKIVSKNDLSIPPLYRPIPGYDNRLHELIPNPYGKEMHSYFNIRNGLIYSCYLYRDSFRFNIDTNYIKKINNMVGFVPSRADEINGLAIGMCLSSDAPTRVNGINAEVLGAIISFPYLTALNYSLFDTSYFKEFVNHRFKQQVNGLNICSTLSECNAQINGLTASFVANMHNEVNGLAVSIFRNCINSLNGLSIAAVNSSTRGRGVQIGLFNTCHQFRGVQIGLWNKNGKRSLPLINWQFAQ